MMHVKILTMYGWKLSNLHYTDVKHPTKNPLVHSILSHVETFSVSKGLLDKFRSSSTVKYEGERGSTSVSAPWYI